MTPTLVRVMSNEKVKKHDDDEKGSHQIRVKPDIGVMIAWIVRLEGGSTAQLLDPMLRAQIEARFEKHRAAVEKIKAAEELVKKVEAEAKAGVTQEDEPAPRGKRRRE